MVVVKIKKLKAQKSVIKGKPIYKRLNMRIKQIIYKKNDINIDSLKRIIKYS